MLSKMTHKKIFLDWLESWTGNKPNELLEFYSNDAYYQDPAFPNGLKGHEQILPYFQKLLKHNPNWKWSLVEMYDTPKGVIAKWKAIIPVNEKNLTIFGMDIIEIKNEKIIRNEVYFDSHKWNKMLQESKK
jgi:steroid delta-isomerase-like uncharacterized protein